MEYHGKGGEGVIYILCFFVSTAHLIKSSRSIGITQPCGLRGQGDEEAKFSTLVRPSTLTVRVLLTLVSRSRHLSSSDHQVLF